MATPNVLLLMSDEHNYRCLGYRDGADAVPVRTPTMDALAESGTYFESAYCPVPICTPSRQCMLTGQEQENARAWGLSSVLRPNRRTLPETFSETGYETCLVGKMHFQGTRQFNGFDHRPYGDITGHGIQQPSHQPDPIDPHDLDTQPRRQAIDIGTRIPNAGVTQIPESQLQERIVSRETISWLREHRHENPDRPWFACASFSRPHFPLTAPRRHFERYWPDDVPEPRSERGDSASHPFTRAKIEATEADAFDGAELRRARAAYLAAVEYLDEVLGDLLATLEDDGFLEDTIVIYVSDHGDMMGEHGLWWKQTWREDSARVPWVIETPTQRDGDGESADVAAPVNLVDLFPTLCGLTDVAAPGDVDGYDLSETVESGTEPDRGPVFTDNFSPPYGEWSAYRMARDGRYKYVRFRDAPELLFDLVADPAERRNLAPDPDGEAATALAELRELVDDTTDFDRIAAERARDRETRAEYALPIPPGTGNAYLMPDGRLIDAATPLYKPDVLASRPETVFEDWPDDADDR